MSSEWPKARPAPGLLVAFEGIDGAGKSTQVRSLEARLRDKGLPVLATREPTLGHWGRKIRESATLGRLGPREELEAFIEDRREHVQSEIAPALREGRLVLVDRYVLSTVAYQGARGFDLDELLRLNDFAPRADICIVLDVAPVLGLERVASRGAADCFENQHELERARRIFVDPRILAATATSAHVLDAAREAPALALEIAGLVCEKLGISLPAHMP